MDDFSTGFLLKCVAMLLMPFCDVGRIVNSCAESTGSVNGCEISYVVCYFSLWGHLLISSGHKILPHRGIRTLESGNFL